MACTEAAIAHREDASVYIEDAVDTREDVTSRIVHVQHVQRMQHPTQRLWHHTRYL